MPKYNKQIPVGKSVVSYVAAAKEKINFVRLFNSEVSSYTGFV